MIDKLIKISTYASQHQVSVTWVYKLVARGELECVEIDGVKFIRVD